VAGAIAARSPGTVYALARHSDGPPELPPALASRPVRDIEPLLDSLRVVKDAAEVAALRHAITITAEAQRAAMRAARPGMMEFQIEAVIEFTFRNLGADRVGFPSIVGSGPNSTTLHYDVNRRRIEQGDLVVMDVGAEYAQYTADVTRTIPMGGRFTPRQRAIYELVLGSQEAALAAVRPGVTVRQLTTIARDYMRQHGGTLCAPRNCVDSFVHGLSHWLGMRVHDVGDYRMPLEPGMVLTVEPGIYLPDEQLGVRIEDDIVVTATGYELLSAAAPRRAEEIEALMNQGAGSGRTAMTSDEELDSELDPADAEDLMAAEPSRSGMVGFVGGLVLGALIGAGIALLVAPERGTVVRRRLKRRWRRAREEARRGVRGFKRDVEREAARRRRWLRQAAEREGA